MGGLAVHWGKCPADPHARRRPKREAEDREPAAFGHGDRGAILASAAVSPPGPQRIIAHMLGACVIQTDGSQHYVYMYCSAGTGTAVLQCTLDFATCSYTILPHGYIP